MSTTLYVSCTVSNGLFESEFYITVRDSAVYVDREKVKVSEAPHNGDKVKGQVVAYFIEEKGDGQVLVELPGEPVVGGLRAWVPKGDLIYAKTA
ncbi:MAG: hypothetical protein ABL995_08690 [Bryobacteraceae bacterium]